MLQITGVPAQHGPDGTEHIVGEVTGFPGAYLTLTSQAAAQASRILGARVVVPLHFEGWAHFTQGRDTLLAAFERAGLADLLHLPRPGESIQS